MEELYLKLKNGQYIHRDVPKGFWAMDRDQLKKHIKDMFPKVEWASNNIPDPMWRILIHFHN